MRAGVQLAIAEANGNRKCTVNTRFPKAFSRLKCCEGENGSE